MPHHQAVSQAVQNCVIPCVNLMERYLVTGGAGFIGSHIVEALLGQGHFVRVFDNFDTGSRQNLSAFSGSLELVEGNLKDAGTVRQAVDGIDYVLHQGARGSVPRSVLDPAGTHHANITGTLHVLIAARDAHVRRVICASSSSVYGETPTLPKQESMCPTPLSPYAISKLTMEQYAAVFSGVYGLETVSLRYFNIYGPRQNPNLQYSAVIPIFVHSMMSGAPCTIFGDGEQTRDFTYVEDCVRANLLACKAAGVSGKVFNIACGNQISVNELFRTLSAILEYHVPPSYQPQRPGDVRYSYADMRKAEMELGFKPGTTLFDGLKRTVEWYKRGTTSESRT